MSHDFAFGFPPVEDFEARDWVSAIEERFARTGDPLTLPTDELAYDEPELCEKIFMSKQEAFRAGMDVGEAIGKRSQPRS